MNKEDFHTLMLYQNEYFDILSEFFISVTGKKPQNFSNLSDFNHNIKQLPEKLKYNAKRSREVNDAYPKLESKLKNLYNSAGLKAYRAAKNIDGCKLNLGGSSRFAYTQLNATRRSLLFADTVLIPDPIMPWFEKSRDEEKFKSVLPLQIAFFVLHLSDLIGNEFDIPPFFIFPSWEKSLEENDPQTQMNSMQLIVDVFSFYVDSDIQSIEDVFTFGAESPDVFFHKIDQAHLFVSPGGRVGESIGNALNKYKNEMRLWRSEDWCKQMVTLEDSRLITYAIAERIQPNYHLLENAEEMNSHPFLCIDAQAHYYQLVANMTNQRAAQGTSFEPSTNAILKSLSSSRLDFLANIDDSQIVQLRKTNENIAFRRELRDLVNSLPSTKLDNLGYVASEVCSHIEAIISKHEKKMRSIQDKYNAKHKYTALLGVGTLGVTMLPILAPFIGSILPLGLASTSGKYIADKLDETAEKKQLSRSMMGVMALAKNVN